MADEPTLTFVTDNGTAFTRTLSQFDRYVSALLFAVSDMAQARAACDMLEQTEGTSEPLRSRSLETAIAVSYARAYTKSTLATLTTRHFGPPKKTDQRELHLALLRLRDKVYAHNDEGGGRSLESLRITRLEDFTVRVEHNEAWHPLDRELLDPIWALCNEQEERFRLMAPAVGIVRPQDREAKLATPPTSRPVCVRLIESGAGLGRGNIGIVASQYPREGVLSDSLKTQFDEVRPEAAVLCRTAACGTNDQRHA